MWPTQEKPLITITGISGFIGSHVLDKALQTLQDKFRIRGCVRNKQSRQEMDPLKRYFGDRLKEVEILSCDLTSQTSMHKVVEGSMYVIHLASPVPGPDVRYEEDVINPAVSGTMYILEAAQKFKVKRVVITSSLCACSEFKSGMQPAVIDDTCWSDMSSPFMSAYTKSKLLAEEAAWNFINMIPTGKDSYHRVELVTLLPGFVIGKYITAGQNTSTSVIKQMMEGRFEYIAKKQVSIVDVEDVAIAHIRACLLEKAGGHRFILSAKTLWLTDIAKTLYDEFGEYYDITYAEVNPFYIKLASLISQEAQQVMMTWGKEYSFDASKSKDILGIEYGEPRTAIIAAAKTMITMGAIEDRSKNKFALKLKRSRMIKKQHSKSLEQ